MSDGDEPKKIQIISMHPESTSDARCSDEPGPEAYDEELVHLHESIGHLSANLSEFSVRLNEIGESNSVAYTAYILGSCMYRRWHLVEMHEKCSKKTEEQKQGDEEAKVVKNFVWSFVLPKFVKGHILKKKKRKSYMQT